MPRSLRCVIWRSKNFVSMMNLQIKFTFTNLHTRTQNYSNLPVTRNLFNFRWVSSAERNFELSTVRFSVFGGGKLYALGKHSYPTLFHWYFFLERRSQEWTIKFYRSHCQSQNVHDHFTLAHNVSLTIQYWRIVGHPHYRSRLIPSHVLQRLWN